MSKPNVKPDTSSPRPPKPEKPEKVPAKPEVTPASDGPLEMDGGRRSPLDGKFESDHRPSR